MYSKISKIIVLLLLLCLPNEETSSLHDSWADTEHRPTGMRDLLHPAVGPLSLPSLLP